LVAFNPLSFAVSGLVAIKTADLAHDVRMRVLENFSGQLTADGDVLALVDAPSLGYKVHPLPDGGNKNGGWSRASMIGAGNIIIENDLLIAEISAQSNWSIISLQDKQTGSNRSILTYGNALQWRSDVGDQYKFGFEFNPNGFHLYNGQVVPLDAAIIEKGPLRTRVLANLKLTNAQKEEWLYTIEYTLVASSPLLNINVTGAVPASCTLLTEFQFPSIIDHYDHGTPYHHDTKQPFEYGAQNDFKITFEATHNFIIPREQDGTTLGAIYHGSVPAWGVINKSLFGALIRSNTEVCNSTGQSDLGSHSVLYSIRVPSGLKPPISGQPLQEALQHNTPIQAVVTTPRSDLPPQYSLASVSSPQPVFITAVKQGSFDSTSTLMRLYQPTNAPVTASLLVDKAIAKTGSARLITALESLFTATKDEKIEVIEQDGDTVTIVVNLTTALTTIKRF